MINETTFSELSTLQKYKHISENGKYIGVRQYYNYYINLYLVNDTFFEVWYFRQENAIERVELLTDNKKLDLYINQMNKLNQNENT